MTNSKFPLKLKGFIASEFSRLFDSCPSLRLLSSADKVASILFKKSEEKLKWLGIRIHTYAFITIPEGLFGRFLLANTLLCIYRQGLTDDIEKYNLYQYGWDWAPSSFQEKFPYGRNLFRAALNNVDKATVTGYHSLNFVGMSESLASNKLMGLMQVLRFINKEQTQSLHNKNKIKVE